LEVKIEGTRFCTVKIFSFLATLALLLILERGLKHQKSSSAGPIGARIP